MNELPTGIVLNIMEYGDITPTIRHLINFNVTDDDIIDRIQVHEPSFDYDEWRDLLVEREQLHQRLVNTLSYKVYGLFNMYHQHELNRFFSKHIDHRIAFITNGFDHLNETDVIKILGIDGKFISRGIWDQRFDIWYIGDKEGNHKETAGLREEYKNLLRFLHPYHDNKEMCNYDTYYDMMGNLPLSLEKYLVSVSNDNR